MSHDATPQLGAGRGAQGRRELRPRYWPSLVWAPSDFHALWTQCQPSGASSHVAAREAPEMALVSGFRVTGSSLGSKGTRASWRAPSSHMEESLPQKKPREQRDEETSNWSQPVSPRLCDLGQVTDPP